MPVSSSRIILHFNVHEPIELVELTLSFGALARQYRQFLVEKARLGKSKVNDADVKLFITKIENNCILAELAGATDILGSLFSIMDYTNTFIDFVKNVNDAITFFRKYAKTVDSTDLKIPYSKKQCEDISHFVEVVAGTNGGELGLSVAEYSETEGETKRHVRFTYSGAEALEAQKGALLAQRTLDQKGDADHRNVLLYFHQTNVEDSKADGRTQERAIIKSISSKPLPVYFISKIDQDRTRNLKDDPKLNPFRASYRVDVNVETDRNDVPKFYRVLRLHEIIPSDESAD